MIGLVAYALLVGARQAAALDDELPVDDQVIDPVVVPREQERSGRI